MILRNRSHRLEIFARDLDGPCAGSITDGASENSDKGCSERFTDPRVRFDFLEMPGLLRIRFAEDAGGTGKTGDFQGDIGEASGGLLRPGREFREVEKLQCSAVPPKVHAIESVFHGF